MLAASRFRGEMVALALMLAWPVQASAQTLERKLTVGLETSLLAYESVSFTEPAVAWGDPALMSNERTLSEFSLGLAATANSDSAGVALPAVIGADVGYAIAEPFV